MAKVKTAKEKITVFLKAKGLDANEIKDAFDELDAADVDLDTLGAQLGDYRSKNEQWTKFWTEQAVPEYQTIATERDTYKAAVEKLKAAGISVDGVIAPPADPNKAAAPPAGNYLTQEALDQFRKELAMASSDTMKSLVQIGFKHFKQFGSEPDLEALEKMMGEKDAYGRPKFTRVEDAYRVWSEPQYETARKTQTEKEIAQKVQEGIQAEMSKRGIVASRKRTDDVEPAPLDKPAPTERELRDAFIKDLSEAPAN